MSGPESRIQSAVNSWAKREYPNDLLPRKFQGGMYGSGGWPDFDYLKKGGEVFFIEYKAPNGAVTELQAQRHAQLRAFGFRVYVCDSSDQAKGIIRTEMRGPAAIKRLAGTGGVT